VTHRTRIVFTAGEGLRTFAANPFNTWIALSKPRKLTKRWLANLLSISKQAIFTRRLYKLHPIQSCWCKQAETWRNNKELSLQYM